MSRPLKPTPTPNLAFRVTAVIALTQIVISAGILLSDPAYPRVRIALASGLGLATLGPAYVALRAQVVGDAGRWDAVASLVGVLLFGAMIAVVEGPGSPLTPLLLHVLVGQASRYGLSRHAQLNLALALATMVLLTLLPRAWFGPLVATPQRKWLWLVVLAGVALSLYLDASAIRRTYRQATEELARLREATLRDHEARARGLEAMGAKVAHELKNPLTSVKALLEMLAEDAVEPASRRRFDVVNGEVGRMQTILADYLSFSRPLDNLRTHPLDLRALAEHVLSIVEARAAEANVGLSVGGPHMEIEGDEERLRAAVLNIVTNAVEATSAGGTVGITVAKGEQGARLFVRDTGRGIEPEDRLRLGTPFFSRKEGGTGLGVVLASNTIRQHGGAIAFDSTPGQGTTVSIDLPLHATSTTDDPSRSYEKLSHLELEALIRSERP